MGHRRSAVLGPLPIDAGVQTLGQVADLALDRRVAVEVRRGGQHAAQQQRGIDRRQLALPRARAALHVEEVIVEPLVTRRVGLGTLLALPEEPQRGERSFRGLGARDKPPFHANRIRGEPQPDRRDARGPVRAGLVEHQSVGVVGLVQEVAERAPLDGVEQLVFRLARADSMTFIQRASRAAV